MTPADPGTSTFAAALRQGTELLRLTSPTPRLDAELLLASASGHTRIHVLAEWEARLTPSQSDRYGELLRRRARGEPVAYLVGTKEFYGRTFAVDRRVLVPRPETEILIEHALAWLRPRGGRLLVADIGTGSGCIAATLALEVPHAQIFATDLSPAALAVALVNLERYTIADRVQLLHGDGLDPLPTPVDLIVSNPPYTILAEVEPEVRAFEPHLALDGLGPVGFDVPARLIRASPAYLRPGGALFMEIGAWQGALAREVAHAVYSGAHIQIFPDLSGRDRILAIETEPSGP